MKEEDAKEAVSIYESIALRIDALRTLDRDDFRSRSISIKAIGYNISRSGYSEEKVLFHFTGDATSNSLQGQFFSAVVPIYRRYLRAKLEEDGRRLAQLGFQKPAECGA